MSNDTPPVVEDGRQRLARFEALLTLAHGNAELVWSRYYSLMTANAIVAVVVGALVPKTRPSLTESMALLFVAVFGLVLTWFWKRLTQHGWRLVDCWVTEAKQIPWPPARNPYEPYSDWCTKTGCPEGTGDQISRYAQRVINLFLIGYGVTAAYAAYWVVANVFPTMRASVGP